LIYKRVKSAKSPFNRGDRVVRMDLVEIDVVGLEPDKAGFDGIHNVSTRSANVIAAGAHTRVSLRRKDDVLARDVQILEGLTECRLALPLGVDVSRIEEVDTSVERGLDQFVDSLLADPPITL